MANYQKKAFPAPAMHVAPQALLAEVEAPTAHETFEVGTPVAQEALRVEDALRVETAEAIEAPMAAAKDVGGNVRALVEKSIVETRSRYAKAKSAAEGTSAAVEASFGAAREGVVAFNVKTIEAIKADAVANFDLFKSLAAAKSVSELVTLQTEFVRKRFEDATSRSKELAEFARTVADQTVAPIKAHVATTFKVAV
jgi:phasin